MLIRSLIFAIVQQYILLGTENVIAESKLFLTLNLGNLSVNFWFFKFRLFDLTEILGCKYLEIRKSEFVAKLNSFKFLKRFVKQLTISF